jgi:putative ABC transport system permease protein
MLNLHEAFAEATDSLRSNKLRAFLTALGVVIGSASIVLVVTVGLTGRKFVISQIESVGSNLVWAELSRTPQRQQPLSYELTPGDLEAVKAIPTVTEVAGTRDASASLVVRGIERRANLVGVSIGFQAIRRLVILHGRFFDPGDMAARSKVCLITQQLASQMFSFEDPMGKSVRMGELSFTVIGTFRERVATLGLSEIQQNSVLVPLPLMKYYTGDDNLGILYAQADMPEDVGGMQRQVLRVLKDRHPAGAEYIVQSLTAVLDAAKRIAEALTLVLVVIALIALGISGIGIMNIMLVTVKERTREIGIRKAVGAAQSQILWQFLFEAFLISAGGAVMGVLVGLAIPAVVQPFLPGNMRVPVSGLSVVISFVVSCSTGLFFGYLPASQAAKLQPVDSLRYE